MTQVSCHLCGNTFFLQLHRNPEYKRMLLCPVCLEIRKLLDGLMVDLNATEIEAMIQADPDISDISRGIKTIN